MSLSSEPAYSLIRQDFVCGYKNIENKKYAGKSRKHKPDGQAVETTNGAGPHNIQMFVLASDGTVLTCLPGYWRSQDLARELRFAKQLNSVWTNSQLTQAQKSAAFREMQIAHVHEHPAAERKRSRMQGFDIQYEVKNRLYSSDVFYQRTAVNPKSGHVPPGAVKTTDVIMHERMAKRPFVAYDEFDVQRFSDYGRPMYDKNEDQKIADGQMHAPSNKQAPMIGNDPAAHPYKTQAKRQTKSIARRGVNYAVRSGIRALIR